MSKDTYDPSESAKRIRPTWRTWTILIIVGALLFLVLAHLGRLALWRPIIFSAIALSGTTAVRWDLHKHYWFWMIVAFYIAAHVVAIMLLNWNTRWFPAALIAPIVVVDCLIILASFQIGEKFIPEESSR